MSKNAMEYPRLALYINGEWLEGGGREYGQVLDPATEQPLGALPHATDADVDAALQAADAALPAWRRTAPIQRGAILRDAAQLLRARLEELAWIITREQGKPLTESRVEVDKTAELFEWSAEESRRVYGRIIAARKPRTRHMVIPVPIGPVVAFSGWNAPAIAPIRKIATALATGCTMVIKPAEETPATALFLARVLHDSGLPDYEWAPISGKAKILSWTAFHRKYLPAYPAPHLVVAVQLEEGPIMVSYMEHGELDRLKLDAEVRMAYADHPDGYRVPKFTLFNQTTQR